MTLSLIAGIIVWVQFGTDLRMPNPTKPNPILEMFGGGYGFWSQLRKVSGTTETRFQTICMTLEPARPKQL